MHFALCRQRIVAQARRWTLEAQTTQFAPRFEKVYSQILGRLSTMKLDLPPLAPLKEDVAFIFAHDPSFFAKGCLDQKPAAAPSREANFAPLLFNAANPWAATSSNAEAASANPWAPTSQSTNSSNKGTTEDEDDFYS